MTRGLTEYVLSVDGGGTSTRVAALALDGRLLGYGRSGPSNYDDVGVEVAQANVQTAVAAACAGGLSLSGSRAVFLGMAGVVSEADHAAIHGIAQRLQLAQPEKIGIDHDCRIALAGGLAGRPGIVQIVGTGTSCYGRNAAGEGWMTGGRGHLISDEGSGYWLGIQTMRAAVMAHDGRLEQGTVLLSIVCESLDIHHMDEILHRLYVQGMSRAEIAALGPLVVEAARAGDLVARSLLRQGAEELAACVRAAARHLGMDADPCEVCCVGGLIQAGPIVTDGLYTAIQERLPTAIISEAELPPVLGAGLLALRQAGSAITPAVLQNLHETKKSIQRQS